MVLLVGIVDDKDEHISIEHEFGEHTEDDDDDDGSAVEHSGDINDAIDTADMMNG